MPGNIMSITADGASALESAVQGFLAMHPALQYDSQNKTIYTKEKDRRDRVTIISGGGSGHEPAHAGYVGKGMLDAAVCGAVFASPNALQIEAGLRQVQSPKGTLVIVKNYTGDKLNFALAIERQRITSRTPVRMVVVADDVSIGRKRSARVGRRGLAGTVLVHKVAGAAAEAGLDLDQVEEAAQFVTRNVGTIGVGLDACSLPGQAQIQRLEPDEIEVGIGIHNEPGSRRVRPRPHLAAIINSLLRSILDTEDQDRNYLESRPRSNTHDTVLLINNLGSLSCLDIAAVTGEVVSQLKTDYQLRPARVYAGTFLSALNGPGFSITLLSLPKSEALSSKVLEWLDHPTDAVGWINTISAEAWAERPELAYSNGSQATSSFANNAAADIPRVPSNPDLVGRIIRAIHETLAKEEPEITRMDTILGDGDCGTTLVSGSAALVRGLDDKTIDPTSLSHVVIGVANLISQSMGGTSGAIYAVFLTGLASAVTENPAPSTVDLAYLAGVLRAALDGLLKVTAARVGDRTMMDSLIPFVETLSTKCEGNDPLAALGIAVEAARRGCLGTSDIESKFGRSTYISAGEDAPSDSQTKIPDPGACGVVAIVEGILQAVKDIGGY